MRNPNDIEPNQQGQNQPGGEFGGVGGVRARPSGGEGDEMAVDDGGRFMHETVIGDPWAAARGGPASAVNVSCPQVERVGCRPTEEALGPR